MHLQNISSRTQKSKEETSFSSHLKRSTLRSLLSQTQKLESINKNYFLNSFIFKFEPRILEICAPFPVPFDRFVYFGASAYAAGLRPRKTYNRKSEKREGTRRGGKYNYRLVAEAAESPVDEGSLFPKERHKFNSDLKTSTRGNACVFGVPARFAASFTAIFHLNARFVCLQR